MLLKVPLKNQIICRAVVTPNQKYFRDKRNGRIEVFASITRTQDDSAYLPTVHVCLHGVEGYICGLDPLYPVVILLYYVWEVTNRVE
jgi:hypothetical protein